MTPVMVLTDGYIANGSEPWRIPEVSQMLPKIEVKHPGPQQQRRRPFCRTSATSGWPGRGPCPGTPGLMHRIGGLEKQDITGNVNYEPANHQHMVNMRASKVAEHCQRYSAAEARWPGDGRPAGAQLGRHLRRLRDGRPRVVPSARARRSRTAICGI